jgi:hypothetical protein
MKPKYKKGDKLLVEISGVDQRENRGVAYCFESEKNPLWFLEVELDHMGAKLVEDELIPNENIWIPVEDGLPDSSMYVLISTQDELLPVMGFYDNQNNKWISFENPIPDWDEVTAWMPLPDKYPNKSIEDYFGEVCDRICIYQNTNDLPEKCKTCPLGYIIDAYEEMEAKLEAKDDEKESKEKCEEESQ